MTAFSFLSELIPQKRLHLYQRLCHLIKVFSGEIEFYCRLSPQTY